MKQLILTKFSMPHLTVLAMFLFLLVFALMVYWAMKKDNKKLFDHVSELPLNDGEKYE